MQLVPMITAGGEFEETQVEVLEDFIRRVSGAQEVRFGKMPSSSPYMRVEHDTFHLEQFVFAPSPEQGAYLHVYISENFMRQFKGKTRVGVVRDYVMANAGWLFTYAVRRSTKELRLK